MALSKKSTSKIIYCYKKEHGHFVMLAAQKLCICFVVIVVLVVVVVLCLFVVVVFFGGEARTFVVLDEHVKDRETHVQGNIGTFFAQIVFPPVTTSNVFI